MAETVLPPKPHTHIFSPFTIDYLQIWTQQAVHMPRVQEPALNYSVYLRCRYRQRVGEAAHYLFSNT